MDVYDKLLEDTKNKMLKSYANFKESPKERITQSYTETRLEALESQWLSFTDTHKQAITEIELNELENSKYIKNNIYDLVEDTYFDYKAELKQTLSSLNKKDIQSELTTQTNVKQINSSCSFKLPKITIPKFSGCYTEWITFRDLYVSLIHNNSSLDNIQKFQYLKSYLTGDAELLLRHIPLTNNNYESSWNKLSDRYSNKRYLSNNIFMRLFGLKVLQSESSRGIKELLDTMSDSLNALDNLGVPTDGWDAIVIFLMSEKLDPDTRKQWESQANSSHRELPTLILFKEFLEHRFRSLEFLDVGNKSRTSKSLKTYSVSINDSNISDALSVNTLNAKFNYNCPFCNNDHRLANCKPFAKDSYEVRHNFVQNNRLCFNCLGTNHSVYMCRMSSRCKICRRKHHSLLHPSSHLSHANQTETNISPVENTVTTTNTDSQVEAFDDIVTSGFSNTHRQVLLATALAKAEARTGNDIVVRCLLDQGSQASFITESTVQALGLKKIPNHIQIFGVGSNGGNTLTSQYVVYVKLKSVYDPNYTIKVKAHVLTTLTRFLPSKMVPRVGIWPVRSNLEMADPKLDTPNTINMLLDAEIYSQILEEGLIKGPPGTPVAQKTKLGWILSGRVQTDVSSELHQDRDVVSMHVQEVEDINEIPKRFWEIENVGSANDKKMLSPEEKRCEEIFAKTTTRDDSGRYIVKLPFRSDSSCKYSNSLDISLQSLNDLDRKLDNNPTLKKNYVDVMKEYLDLGYMKLVSDQELMDKLDNRSRQDDGTRKSLELGKEGDQINKVLGISWNSTSDEREYSVKLPEVNGPDTKGRAITDIPTLFDPLGWLAPIIIKAKIMIQKLWISGIDWVEQLSSELLVKWLNYRNDLPQLLNFRLPRGTHMNPDSKEFQILGFSDASHSAFAAVVNIQTQSSNVKVNMVLITSKTKVGPTNQISKLRLELLAKLLAKGSQVLKIQNKDVHAWTDSAVALAWLRSRPGRWKTFVGNRVSEIITHWSHIKSEDCASKGVNPPDMTNLSLWSVLWLQVPTWLKSNIINYSPLEDSHQVVDLENVEISTRTLCGETIADDSMETISRFSSLRKLISVLLYCRRVIQLRLTKIKPMASGLTLEEWQPTLMTCISSKDGRNNIWHRTYKRIWSKEYLSQFLCRYRWNKHTPEPKIGDFVLMWEDDLPPARWLYRMIVTKHPGPDNLTHVVTLCCKNSIIKRPVSKLCILPVSD